MKAFLLVVVVSLVTYQLSYCFPVAGRLLDAAGHPVSGAEIKVISLDNSTVSDISGRFDLSKSPHINVSTSYVPSPRIEAGLLYFSVPDVHTRVTADLYNITGKKICPLINTDLPQGIFTIGLLSNRSISLAAGVYIVRLSVDGINYALKTILVDRFDLNKSHLVHHGSLLPNGKVSRNSILGESVTVSKNGIVLGEYTLSSDAVTDITVDIGKLSENMFIKQIQQSFEYSGKSITYNQVVSRADGYIFNVKLDGSVLSSEELNAMEDEDITAYRKLHGRLMPGLVDKLNSLSATDEIEVQIMAKRIEPEKIDITKYSIAELDNIINNEPKKPIEIPVAVSDIIARYSSRKPYSLNNRAEPLTDRFVGRASLPKDVIYQLAFDKDVISVEPYVEPIPTSFQTLAPSAYKG